MTNIKQCPHTFLGTLADPLKVKIIFTLIGASRTVSELCKELKEEQSKISHALKAMRLCSIVSFEKKGKGRIYSVNKKILPIFKLVADYEKKFCKICRRR